MIRHGLTGTYEYKSASNARTRCLCSKHKRYHDYGGRGIEFRFSSIGECAQYIIDELGRRPDGMTLDRINSNGHYERGNLRWATWEQQARNKRKPKPPIQRLIGIKLTAPEVLLIRESTDSQRTLAKRFGVHQVTIGEIKRREIWAGL